MIEEEYPKYYEIRMTTPNSDECDRGHKITLGSNSVGGQWVGCDSYVMSKDASEEAVLDIGNSMKSVLEREYGPITHCQLIVRHPIPTQFDSNCDPIMMTSIGMKAFVPNHGLKD